MTPLEFTAVVFAFSILAGVVGSLLGLGGGIVVIPVLTLLLGVDIRLAIAASAVAVVGTSCAAAGEHVRTRLANVRLSSFLELGAAGGALTGAFVSGMVAARWLFVLFGVVLAVSGAALLKRTHRPPAPLSPGAAGARGSAMHLDGSSIDDDGREVPYRVQRPRLGLALIYVAGVLGGLLGVGAGVLKVPALDVAMRVPWRASTATSTLMMGVTAVASAGVFLARGAIAPIVVAPVAVGIVAGAQIGSRLLCRIPTSATRILFLGVVFWMSVQMIRRGLA